MQWNPAPFLSKRNGVDRDPNFTTFWPPFRPIRQSATFDSLLTTLVYHHEFYSLKDDLIDNWFLIVMLYLLRESQESQNVPKPRQSRNINREANEQRYR